MPTKRTSSRKASPDSSSAKPDVEVATDLTDTDSNPKASPELSPSEQVEALIEQAPKTFALPTDLSPIDRLRIIISYVQPAKTCIFDDRSKSWIDTKPTNIKTALDQLNPELPEDRMTLMALAICQIKQEMLQLAESAD